VTRKGDLRVGNTTLSLSFFLLLWELWIAYDQGRGLKRREGDVRGTFFELNSMESVFGLSI